MTITTEEREMWVKMIEAAFGHPSACAHQLPAKKWVIDYDSGFGFGREVVEAASLEEATQKAYNRAAEIWESNMFRRAREYDPITDKALSCG